MCVRERDREIEGGGRDGKEGVHEGEGLEEREGGREGGRIERERERESTYLHECVQTHDT